MKIIFIGFVPACSKTKYTKQANAYAAGETSKKDQFGSVLLSVLTLDR